MNYTMVVIPEKSGIHLGKLDLRISDKRFNSVLRNYKLYITTFNFKRKQFLSKNKFFSRSSSLTFNEHMVPIAMANTTIHNL